MACDPCTLASSAFRGLKPQLTYDACRLPDGSQLAVKVAPCGSEKEMQLRHEAKGYLTVRELWKVHVPELLLAGPLLTIGDGYGIGTALVPGHPLQPGVDLLDHLRSNEKYADSSFCIGAFDMQPCLSHCFGNFTSFAVEGCMWGSFCEHCLPAKTQIPSTTC